jgi:hypothetical protein
MRNRKGVRLMRFSTFVVTLSLIVGAWMIPTPVLAAGPSCAAVALHPKVRAFGQQSQVTNCALAKADAQRWCKYYAGKKGGRGNCEVRASSTWVAGITCGAPRNVDGWSFYRDAKDEVEAINGVLVDKFIKNQRVTGCIMVLRHGLYGKVHVDESAWSATISCGGKDYTIVTTGAANAVSLAFDKAGNLRAKACTVKDLHKV